MLKKVILGALLIGLVSALTVGAINRTIDKRTQVAGASATGRGQGGSARSGVVVTGQDSERGRGQSTVELPGVVTTGRGRGQGRGQQNSDDSYGGWSSAERQYPNATEASGDWATSEGVVIQAPGQGVDLIIETDAGEELQIGTGPSYLESQGFALETGEAVQVRGYWEGSEFKAAELVRLQDGQAITLRDELGRPAWAGAGRRAQGNARSEPGL